MYYSDIEDHIFTTLAGLSVNGFVNPCKNKWGVKGKIYVCQTLIQMKNNAFLNCLCNNDDVGSADNDDTTDPSFLRMP